MIWTTNLFQLVIYFCLYSVRWGKSLNASSNYLKNDLRRSFTESLQQLVFRKHSKSTDCNVRVTVFWSGSTCRSNISDLANFVFFQPTVIFYAPSAKVAAFRSICHCEITADEELDRCLEISMLFLLLVFIFTYLPFASECCCFFDLIHLTVWLIYSTIVTFESTDRTRSHDRVYP